MNHELLRYGHQRLLILCDYDGTLAPLVLHPQNAVPEQGAQAVLQALLKGAQHRVVIVTGRNAEQVHAFLGLPELTVIGLHGMQWPQEQLQPPAPHILEMITAQVPKRSGLYIENKTFTVAVHFREVPESDQNGIDCLLSDIRLPSGWESVAGKKVREFRPIGFGKGRAAVRLARQALAYLPIFIGDDVTDEEAFVLIKEIGGITIKVGEGPTAAVHRLDSPQQVIALLQAWAAL